MLVVFVARPSRHAPRPRRDRSARGHRCAGCTECGTPDDSGVSVEARLARKYGQRREGKAESQKHKCMSVLRAKSKSGVGSRGPAEDHAAAIRPP